jgi:hypothetical protein
MTALTVRQFDNSKASQIVGNLYSASVKYNPTLKRIKGIAEDLVFRKNDSRISPAMPRYKQKIGTVAVTRGIAEKHNQLCYYGTQGTGYLDFWLGEVTSLDYSTLLDDYDVVEIEESHMQSALNYGW